MKKNGLVLIIILVLVTTFFLIKLSKNTNTPLKEPTVLSDESSDLIDSKVSPNGKSRGDFYRNYDSDEYHYYELFITNLKTNEKNLLYSGDVHTGSWQWTPDNKVQIQYDCGTGCKASKEIVVGDKVFIGDMKEGEMSEENGWKVEFFE